MPFRYELDCFLYFCTVRNDKISQHIEFGKLVIILMVSLELKVF